MQKSNFDTGNKIWRGPKVNPLYNPEQSLGFLILNLLQQTPDAITQISADTDVSVTCKQMYNRTIKVARFLTNCGIKEGDLLGFVASNTENLAPITYACFTLGLPINPLAPLMNESDIVQMFSKTKPKMIFCDAENLKVVQNAVSKMKSNAKIYTVMDKVDGYECVTEILKKMGDEDVNDFVIPTTNPNSTAAIMCSSGSTGFPKGICKSHKQLIATFQAYWMKPRTKAIRFFQFSSIFWVSGFYILYFSVILSGIRITTRNSFDSVLFANIIKKYKVTDIATAPFALVNFLKNDLQPFESIEYWIVSGAPLAQSLCENFEQLIPNGMIINGYGCTEEGIMSINKTGQKYNSTGMVCNNLEIKIIDSNGTSLGHNEYGEICTKVPIQFSGYLGDPIKTTEAFNGNWFKTGDIGYFDNDSFLYVIDRKKDLMKYCNYQITSREIEQIIDEIKGIISSRVVGVPEGETGNDIIYAFVIVDKSYDLTESFILNYVNERVIDPKRIRGGVHLVESFPLGLSEKVDRKKVRAMAQKLYEKEM